MRALQARSLLAGRRPGSAAGDQPAQLQLTSLVDMMVILVVFLLHSFSVEGELIAPAAGLDLPDSASDTPVPVGLVVEVGARQVRVAGRDILPTVALADADTTSLIVLTAALTKAAAAADHGRILVQADRRVDFRNLSQVLRACSRAGWSDVSLVVLGAES